MIIGVLGAMEEEVKLIKASLEQIEIVKIAHLTFYTGTLHNHDIVLVQCGIGKVASSVATTLLVEAFKPDYVINTGSAGGLDAQLNIGDLVIGTQLIHHDVDVTHFGYDLGQVAQMPPVYHSDERLVRVATNTAKTLDINTVNGLIGTGDSFIGSDEAASALKKLMPQLKATEMEGAAIAQTCYLMNIPFVIIRSLSDIAGKTSTVSFTTYLETAAKNSAHLVMRMIQAI